MESACVQCGTLINATLLGVELILSHATRQVGHVNTRLDSNLEPAIRSFASGTLNSTLRAAAAAAADRFPLAARDPHHPLRWSPDDSPHPRHGTTPTQVEILRRLQSHQNQSEPHPAFLSPILYPC